MTTSSDMFYSSEDVILQTGPVWSGTAIGWKKLVDKFVRRLPIVSDRFCGIIFSDYLIIYTAYLPTSGQDEDFLEILAILEHDIMSHYSSTMSIIIGTDSNCSIKSTTRRQKAMNEFLSRLSLQSIMCLDEPTFHHHNQMSESKIDHIYTNLHFQSDTTVSFSKLICQKDNSANLSAHDVLVAKMTLPEIKAKKAESSPEAIPTYDEFVVRKPLWNEDDVLDYQNECDQVLEELFDDYNDHIFLPVLSEMVSKTLVIAAENSIKCKKPVNTEKKKLPHFSKEYRTAHEEHKRNCNAWRKCGRPSDFSHPAKAAVLMSRRKLQKIVREEDYFKALDSQTKLMNCYSNDLTKAYSILKDMRGTHNKNTDIPFLETLNGNYEADNVLEGFRANTEILCNESSQRNIFFRDNFYKMSVADNMMIFDITANSDIKIPAMSLSQLKEIVFKRLKLRKACDIYKLTVEHLRFLSDKSLSLILKMINNILTHINTISSAQLNTSVASVIYKGKSKPMHLHKSYRLVRVTPLIGRIIDEYMRPTLIDIVRPMQNKNQYGFTEKISYLMGALQRHEVEKYCVDMKLTFFGCSLDGDSAFEVVNREIQTRELYFAGEEGMFWQASHFSYQNTYTKIKMNGKVSGLISESLGVKQGRNKSSDHYKVYIAPLLNALDDSNLGVWIGNINVGVSGVANDVYLMSDKQNKLQEQLSIA